VTTAALIIKGFEGAAGTIERDPFQKGDEGHPYSIGFCRGPGLLKRDPLIMWIHCVANPC